MADKIETEVQPVDVDTTALLAEKDAKIAKLQEISENYRKGMLAAKGKLPNDGSVINPDDLDALVDAKVKSHIADTDLFKAQEEKDKFIAKTVKELNEAKVALKNRSQVGAPAGQGGGQSATEVKTEFWTAEQLAELKRRGVDPEKAKENYLKTKNQ